MLNLRYFVLPGKYLPIGFENEYKSAYKTYSTCWGEAFRELFGNDFVLYSNDFTRQDYVHALFNGNECIAVAFQREIDLNNPADLDDSWFKPWKKSHFANLVRAGYRHSLMYSNFTVQKLYRKSVLQNNLSISHIFGCLHILYQFELGIPLMFGMTRNDRSMDKLTAKWGAEVIERGLIHNTTATDLIIFTTQSIQAAMKDFPDIAFDLFQNRHDYFSQGDQRARSA